MRHKVVFAVGGCVAAVLTQTASLPISAAPGPLLPRFGSIATGSGSSRPQVFTLRYVAFVAQPKTRAVAALYRRFPPLLTQGLNGNSRYAMTTTPEDFVKVLQTDQSDHNFKIALAGSVVLQNSRSSKTLVSDGPNPLDPYGLTLVDTISINQNSDTTLDFVSQGTLSYRSLGSGDLGGTQGWRGENKGLGIGRTYLWGADKKPNGTCVTWAFCILPGNLDQVASTWKRRDGTQERALASDKTVERRLEH